MSRVSVALRPTPTTSNSGMEETIVSEGGAGYFGVLPIADQLQCRSARRAKSPNIAYRWLAEEPAVFAVELAGAFVSDLKGRGQDPEMTVDRGHGRSPDFR